MNAFFRDFDRYTPLLPRCYAALRVQLNCDHLLIMLYGISVYLRFYLMHKYMIAFIAVCNCSL